MFTEALYVVLYTPCKETVLLYHLTIPDKLTRVFLFIRFSFGLQTVSRRWQTVLAVIHCEHKHTFGISWLHLTSLFFNKWQYQRHHYLSEMAKGHRTLYDFGCTTDRLWIWNKTRRTKYTHFYISDSQSVSRTTENHVVCSGVKKK